MTDRELMQQAVDVLQAVRNTPASKDEIQRAWIVSDLLKRRLAQPEHEPVVKWDASATLVVHPHDAFQAAEIIRAAERERIIAANAPEIERINAHIKELEEEVKAEREACAALVDANAMACTNPIYRSLLQSNADAIRARGQP